MVNWRVPPSAINETLLLAAETEFQGRQQELAALEKLLCRCCSYRQAQTMANVASSGKLRVLPLPVAST